MPPKTSSLANIFNEDLLVPEPTDAPELETVTQIEELPDGSAVYQIGEGVEEPEFIEESEEDFYEDLSDKIGDGVLSRISSELLEEIKNDEKSRKEWEQAISKGMELLGYKYEEYRDYPFMRACAAYDSTMSTAHMRFYSTARAELFPNEGPATYQTVGDVSDEQEMQGEKLKAWMNYYLTRVDKDYYPDSERMLIYLGLVGCAFKKVYQDPITNRPVARFIDPQDFIVNNDARSILSSNRLTHRMYLTKKELILRQISGFYRDLGIPDFDDEDNDSEITKSTHSQEGVEINNWNKPNIYQIYEIHADLNIEGFEHKDEDGNETGMPLPYIITICNANRRVLSVRRNWVKDDPTFARIQCFVSYTYIPGFGIYGIGLAHLIGSNSNTLTSILRQLIDSGTLKNFPGGLRIKGMRLEKNDKPIGPSEFLEIETGGMRIQDAIMTMPYNEPSVVLNQLRNELIEQTQMLAGTTEMKLSESKPDAPVGTTLALLEIQNKMQSSVMRSLHKSLSYELELLYRLFSEGMDEENPYDFNVPGLAGQITKHDFTDDIKIIPVSDPNLTTSTQRLLRAEAILRLAQSAPEIHDMRNAYHRMYVAMGLTDINKLLPPEQEVMPLDPITENMNAMEGKPIKAAIWQDHKSHIMVHETFAQQNPDVQAMQAHLQEHRALDYYMQMQSALGFELPPLDQLEDPEVQNNIAMAASQVAMQQREMMQEQNPPPLDPTKALMMDMQTKVEIAKLKEQEAKLKAEVESYKAQLAFETTKNKIAAEREIAEERNATELAVAEMKAEVDLQKAREKAHDKGENHGTR